MTKRKQLEKKLDKAFSLKIKWRDDNICQWCQKEVEGRGAQCAHIVGRTNRLLRWDEDNALCLCYTCHRTWHSEPLLSGKWFEETFPERYEYLQERRHQTRLWTIEELEEKLEALK